MQVHPLVPLRMVCIAPLASVMLLLRARRELRGRGFRLGWLVVNAPAEAYGLD